MREGVTAWHGALLAAAFLCWSQIVLAEDAVEQSTESAESAESTESTESTESAESAEIDGANGRDPFSANPFGADPNGVGNIPAEEREGRAAELAREGRLAFGEHRLEDSARLLERSYQLVPEATVLYPLALALHGLGHYEAAEERLRRYMAEADLDGSQRYVLQLQLQGWRRQFSRVTIETEPQGAELLLGHQLVGITPMAEPLILPNGEYQLEARLAGYRTITQQLIVPGGAPFDLRLVFERPGTGRTGPSRGLRVGLWTTVGLTAATLVATVVVGALWGVRRSELREASYPTPELVDREAALFGPFMGTIGAFGALATATVALGAVYGVRSRETEGE